MLFVYAAVKMPTSAKKLALPAVEPGRNASGNQRGGSRPIFFSFAASLLVFLLYRFSFLYETPRQLTPFPQVTFTNTQSLL
jgi:hypothetical protein